METLGNKLKQLRELIGLTLRQIEEVTGISNAYLSQLENNKIKSPSAQALYKLASIYRVSIDELLIAAGIIKNEDIIHDNKGKSIHNLSDEEEKQLLDYLHFLRYKRAKQINQ